MSEKQGKNMIDEYEKLFHICNGTQEYFWKQVLETINDEESINQAISQVDGANADYIREYIEKLSHDFVAQVSGNTARVLMALLLKATVAPNEQGIDKVMYDLKEFNLKMERLVIELLQSSALSDLLSRVA